MPIPVLPSDPYGEIPPHWHEWLDALDAWEVPTDMPRPCLFMPPGDLDGVRSRIEALPEMKTGIENGYTSAVETGLPDSPTDDPREVLTWAGRMSACANQYLLTGDDEAAERGWAICRWILDQKRWVPDEHLPLTIDLRAAHILHSMGLLLDKTHAWTKAHPDAVPVDGLMQRGVVPFVAISDAHSEWWTYSIHNWRSVICYEIGTLALSMMEYLEPDLLKRALKHALIGQLAVLDEGDDDGGWYEGVGYWRYGIGEAVGYGDMLQRVSGGAVNLFTHPFLQKTGDFGLHLTWHDGTVYNWGDCGDKVNASALLARLAQATGRSDWAAYVKKFAEAPTLDTLYYFDDLPEAAPLESLPRVARFRGAGTAILRSGWDADDMTLGIKAGQTTANHSHLDIASFQLRKGDQTFIDDGGHWPYGHMLGMFDLEEKRWDFPGMAAETHSTIVVDGNGQAWGPDNDGDIIAIADNDDWAFATIDGARAYPELSHFGRYFLLIRPDTLVIMDDLKAKDRVRFGWRAVLGGPAVREDWSRWLVQPEGSENAMSLECLMPSPEVGLMAEQTELDVTYPAGHKPCDQSLRLLTVSPFLRAREMQMVFAMRIGKHTEDAPLRPRVTVREAYRSVQITAETDTGERTWSIMLGEPGVQLIG